MDSHEDTKTKRDKGEVVSTSGLRDNHSRGKAGDFLRENIVSGSELSFVSAYFTVHAYQALRDELESASKLRFLFGEPSFIRSIEKDGKQSRQFQLADQGLTLANQLSQKKLAQMDAKLLLSRDALLPTRQEQATEDSQFELVTWLVIKEAKA